MTKSYEEILAENEELRRSLGESQELLRAISSGEVDALVVSRPEGEQVFTLEGADRAYRVLIEAMNDGALTIDPDGTILYCNSRFAEMVKTSLEKVIGSSIYHFIPQADHSDFRAIQKGLGRGELALSAKAESILPVYISINSLTLSESKKAFCVVVTDLTEQKHKEEIVAAEKLARSIIEQATEAVVVCNESGKIIRFSNALSRILGFDPSLQSFEDLFDLRLPIGKRLSPVSVALHGEVLLQTEALFERNDGVQLHVLLNAGPLKSAGGKIIGCVVTLTDITESREAEAALRQSQSMLARAEMIANIGSWEWDLTSDELIWSEHAYRIFGKDSGQYIPTYESFLAQIHPDYRQLMVRAVDVALSCGKPFDLEYQIVVPGSTTRWVHSSGEVFLDEKGQPTSMIGTVLDITERKTVEETLRVSEEKYKELVENANSIIINMDCNGKITFFNDYAQKFFGYSLEEILGKDVKILLPPIESDSGRSLGKMVDNILKRPDDFIENINENVRKNGELVWISWRNKAIRDPNGNLLGNLAIGQDITARKRAEDALQESEEEYRYLVENAPISIYELDFAGKRFKRVNDAMCRVLGYTREELLAQNPSDLLDEESQVRFQERICKVLAAEPIDESVSYRIFGKDGREIWAALSINLIRTNGKFDGALVFAQDISERKKMEDALREAKEDLELRVVERTAELSEAKEELECTNEELRLEIEEHNRTEKALLEAKEELECTNEELRLEIEEHNRTEKALLEAKDAAEAAAQAKSDFMANMSHEIRTPMNAVIGMTSLLLDDEIQNPEHREFIETIRMSGDALMVIINDILDFSKMQEDLVILEDQPFELAKCMEEALDLVAGKASEKGLNLAYTIDKSVPDVIIGDPNRLRQILSNLLSNAVKFTERGEIKLSASAQKLNGTHEIRFAVQDTGIGISQDQMDHLFVPFTQADSSVTRNYGGTGLGLVISKKLVELMEGEIWVESVPGKGSTFYFTIKAEIAPGDPDMRLVGDQPQLVGKHVLIVSDNRTNRRILGGYIYSWGMVPLVAAKTKDAQNWIQRGDTFDVAILDADMPEMDGLAFADEIRRHNKTLPLVILTSIGQHLPTNHAYLTKPIKPSQLHEILTNIISAQLAQKSERIRAVDMEIPTSSLRILLAEDNVTSQKVAMQMLSRLGYRADVVANGIEALQALERQPYDLVLMDVKMPEMDGLQAARIIRQRWPDNGPKIIAVTAYALQGDKEKCIEAGMDDYISKPIRMNELAAVLMLKKFAQDS